MLGAKSNERTCVALKGGRFHFHYSNGINVWPCPALIWAKAGGLSWPQGKKAPGSLMTSVSSYDISPDMKTLFQQNTIFCQNLVFLYSDIV